MSFLFKLVWLLSLCCSLNLAFPLSVFAQAEAPALQNYQRKYVSIYQSQNNPLDSFLSRYFQRELPRFDYPLQAFDMELSLPEFLSLARQYQQDHAGELAAGQELTDLRVGEKVVSWSETQRLMGAAYVMAPDWHFGPITIAGPEKPKNSETWYLSFESQLNLSLPVYHLREQGPELIEDYKQDWKIVRLLPIQNPEGLRQRMLRELGHAPELTDAQAFLKQLRQLQPFQQLFARVEQDNPAPALTPVAVQILERELQPIHQLNQVSEQVLNLSLGSLSLLNPDALGQVNQLVAGVTSLYRLQELTAKLKRNPDFAIKGQVMGQDPKTQRVTLSLPEGETTGSLGVHLDQGYKILEYQGPEKGQKEIGFLKLRALAEKEVFAEPILMSRPFEAGDQYQEYAKTDWQVNLKGGIGSLTLDPRLGPQDFQPEGSLEILYSLARILGWSETYFQLNGSLGQLAQGTNSLLALSAELGLSKRFYFQQWVLALGLRVGQMNASLSQGQTQGSLSQSLLGGTAFAGLYYQATPDLILGLDAGWRYYPADSTQWKGPQQAVNLGYGLESNGPVAALFLNYQL